MYVGELTYLERRYFFIIREKLMKLTPLDGGTLPIMIPASNSGGLTTSAESMRIQQSHFIGECYDDGKKIVITPKVGSFGLCNFSMTLPIAHIIEFIAGVRKIARITLCCEELDWIYNIKQFVGHKGYPFTDDGKEEHATVFIDVLSKAAVDLGSVKLDGIDVSCQLGLSMLRSFSKTPISLKSIFQLRFEETDDYTFLHNLIRNVEKLLNFLCYRRNVNFTDIRFEDYSIGPTAEFQQHLHNLANKETTELRNNEDAVKKYYTCANLVESELFMRSEDKNIVEGRYIPYKAIEGKVCDLFQEIIDGNLYLRHIPDTFAIGNRVNPPNFIMIMAAFEGEHVRLNSDPIQKPKRTDAQNTVMAQLEALKKDSATTKDMKKIYKYLLKQIDHRPLNTEVLSSLKAHEDILTPFMKYLYGINGIDCKLSNISERVCGQRNDFAHGNLAKPFKSFAALDIRIMEYLVYIMQLSKYNVPTENIQGALKKLFAVNIEDGITYI